jgi:CheY-like chemotaxis protein
MGAIHNKSRGGVLAIDDEPELLKIVKGSLEAHGFEVHTASSAKEGVEFYEQNWENINLVLLDFLMPEMTGDLVFECLKHKNPVCAPSCLPVVKTPWPKGCLKNVFGATCTNRSLWRTLCSK